MREYVAKSLVVAVAVFQGLIAEAGPDWIEEDHGDAGSVPSNAQVTQGSAMGGALGRITGVLGGLTAGGGVAGGFGDFEDMYLIHIADPLNFCATTVPCGSSCGSAAFDTQLWLFDANGLGLLGNNDTAIPGVGPLLVTGSTLGPFACDETESAIPRSGLYYLAITHNNVPLNNNGPIFTFDDESTCGPGEISGPDGPGAPTPVVEWTLNVVDYDIQVLGGRAGDYGTEFTISGLESPNSQVVTNQGTLADPSQFDDWNMSWNFGTDVDGTVGQVHVGSGFTMENTMPETVEGASGSLRFVVNLSLNVTAPDGPALVGGNAALTLLTRPSADSSAGELTSVEGPVWTGLVNGSPAASLFNHPFALVGASTPITGSTSVTNATVPVFQYNEHVDSIGVRIEFDLTPGEKASFNGILAALPIFDGVAGTEAAPGSYVISLCGSEPAEQQTNLAMDVRPFFCPNPYFRFSNGALPIAIMGTDSFDIGNVVVSSVRLSRPDGDGGSIGSVPPLSSPWGPISLPLDVGSPYAGELCGCDDHDFDGNTDVLMFFRSEWVTEQLQLDDLEPGDFVEVNLTGTLTSGEEFIARDCILIIGSWNAAQTVEIHSGHPDAWVTVSPPDINLDEGGFGSFTRGYDTPTTVTLTAPAAPNGYVFSGWRVDNFARMFSTPTLQLNINGAHRDVTPVYQPISGSKKSAPIGSVPVDSLIAPPSGSAK